MDFMQIVASLGFPIGACTAMGYYVKYISDKHREQLDALSKQHKEEMKAITETIANNTLALQRLTDLIERRDD